MTDLQGTEDYLVQLVNHHRQLDRAREIVTEFWDESDEQLGERIILAVPPVYVTTNRVKPASIAFDIRTNYHR